MKLPPGLCFTDRSSGKLHIQPVMRSRAEEWIDSLDIDTSATNLVILKQRRSAMMDGKKRIRDQYEGIEAPPKKRARKTIKESSTASNEVQSKIYWAAIEASDADNVQAFIEAMAKDPSKRNREEEQAIDRYWSQGMSLDPILRSEGIRDIRDYLKYGTKNLKEKEYTDRGIEEADLDGINEGNEARTARATWWQKAQVSSMIPTGKVPASKTRFLQ